MRGKHITETNPYSDKIRDLEEELGSARRAIVSLMPQELRTILDSYYTLESSDDLHRWEYESANAIVGLAAIFSPEEGSYWQDRANCPLCGRGAQSTYANGFTVPEGLYRHLVGWGNAHQCSVFKAAWKLALGYVRRSFGEAEAAARLAKDRLTEERKKSETLYKISPYDDAVLLDAGFWSAEKVRDEDQMVWATERLATLGFEKSTDERVTAFTNESTGSVVYADPRGLGEIKFTLWPLPLPKKGSKASRKNSSFYIKDNWRHDLTEKYRVRVEQASESLK